jgi:hypothetical protein
MVELIQSSVKAKVSLLHGQEMSTEVFFASAPKKDRVAHPRANDATRIAVLTSNLHQWAGAAALVISIK